MGAKTARPNRELPVAVDVEGGVISARDVKAAREVAADAMTERDFQRLAKQITDQARDEDSSLTRAARDRDRATPRDASQVDSARLRGDLPAEGEFRRALSGRQRKIRSAIKNQVMASAPASQHKAIRTMLTEEDAREWRRINGGLHVVPAMPRNSATVSVPRFSDWTEPSSPTSVSTTAPIRSMSQWNSRTITEMCVGCATSSESASRLGSGLRSIHTHSAQPARNTGARQ